MLIDSHCHVLSSEYDNSCLVIEKALNNKVDKIIINGFDIESSKEAVLLAEKYNQVYAAVGIGPQNIEEIKESDIKVIEDLAKSKKVVAIGEIGLDYYWTTETKEKQLYVFHKMLAISKKYNLPVIVHSRKAISDTYNLLSEYGVNGIMHCYSGSFEMAKEFIKLGFLIGIGGVVTFKNAKEIKEIVQNLDINYISLETDSPYLSPEPKRGEKNVPENILYVAQKIAELKGISTDEVVYKTGLAVARKFDL